MSMAYTIIFCGTLSKSGSDDIVAQLENEIASDFLFLEGPDVAGGGIFDNMQKAIAAIISQYENGVKEFNFVGWSRGSATAILLMRSIDTSGGIYQTVDSKKSIIIAKNLLTINAFLCDPVGMTAGIISQEMIVNMNSNVLPNFNDITIVYATKPGGKGIIFLPMTYTTATSNNTNLNIFYNPDSHSGIVNKNTACGYYTWLLMHRFLNEHNSITKVNSSLAQELYALSNILSSEPNRDLLRSYLPRSSFPYPMVAEQIVPIISKFIYLHHFLTSNVTEIPMKVQAIMIQEISHKIISLQQYERSILINFLIALHKPRINLSTIDFGSHQIVKKEISYPSKVLICAKKQIINSQVNSTGLTLYPLKIPIDTLKVILSTIKNPIRSKL